MNSPSKGLRLQRAQGIALLLAEVVIAVVVNLATDKGGKVLWILLAIAVVVTAALTVWVVNSQPAASPEPSRRVQEMVAKNGGVLRRNKQSATGAGPSEQRMVATGPKSKIENGEQNAT
jgi:hypothetical protein